MSEIFTVIFTCAKPTERPSLENQYGHRFLRGHYDKGLGGLLWDYHVIAEGDDGVTVQYRGPLVNFRPEAHLPPECRETRLISLKCGLGLFEGSDAIEQYRARDAEIDANREHSGCTPAL